MIKRLLNVIGIIIVIGIWCYLHGKLWQLVSPEKFIGEIPIWMFTIVGVLPATLMTVFYILMAVLLWPIIGGIINYIAGREICNIPKDEWDGWHEE